MSRLENIAEEFLQFSDDAPTDAPISVLISPLEIIPAMCEKRYDEIIIFALRSKKDYKFNLADIFALARFGAKQLTRYQITEEK